MTCYPFYNVKNELQHQHQGENLEEQMHEGTGSPAWWRKKSTLNPALFLVKLAKYPDDDKETGIIKMRIVNTISNDNKTNYKTKSFKVIKDLG